MTAKKNPLNLNSLQLKTLTLLQELARSPVHAKPLGEGAVRLSIGFEGRGIGLLQGNCKSTDLVIVRTTLERWENREVDLVLKIINCTLWLTLLRWLWTLPVEDHSSPRAP